MALAGYPSEFIEKTVEIALKYLQKNLSPKMQLALTLAAEHYTATMANYLLESGWITKSEPSYAWLWRVHAVEEIEHRAVTFDVYEYIGDYKTRMIAYFLASLIVFMSVQILYIMKDKSASIIDTAEWIEFGKFIGSLMISIGPELIKFVHPFYHPDLMNVTDKFDPTRKMLGFSD